ncbi:MAG: DUF4249 domain-containing protein [Bacteroidales bacterium]|jgi:hypothetical protein|nr:DUF4249 domain-containing protein [Bacteroidales bacterium]
MSFYKYIILISAVLLISCQKEIDVELPPYSSKIIVEGWIDYDDYATVFVTRSSDYFAPLNEEALMDMIITDAVVVVEDLQGVIDTLKLGFDETLSFPLRYKGDKIKGEYGGVYNLRIFHEEYIITATTTIPQPFEFDTIYYVEQFPEHRMGFLRMKFTDRAGENNYYRIFSMVLGKHSNFRPALNSTFDDRLFDGQEMIYELYQGQASNIISPDYYQDSLHYLKYYFGDGDTILLKYATMDYDHYKFWYTAEWIINAGDNPFLSPAPIHSNIDGAMGVWGGYASRIDTLYLRYVE